MTQKGGGEEVEDICKGLMRSDYNDGAGGEESEGRVRRSNE